MSYFRRLLRWSSLFALCALPAAYAQEYTKPRVRAITGFVRLDRAHYTRDVNDALTVLRQAKENLVKQGYEVQTVRIVTQPMPELVGGLSDADAFAFLKRLDQLAAQADFSANVGPAMLRDTDDPHMMQLLAEALSVLPHLQASAMIAGEDGIHWKAIHATAGLVRYVTDHGVSTGGAGNLNFTATAMVKPYGPFFPGAYHLGSGKQFSIGFEGANVVREVFSRTHGEFSASVSELTQQLTIHAKVAEAVGQKVAAATGWSFKGVDPTPAPTPRPQMSIGSAIEQYTGAAFGSSGTLTAALAITTAVKAVPVLQVGYSGLMIPVMEDSELAARWSQGAVHMDDLLAYSAVCGTGLDTIPLPADVSTEQLARIYGDVAALAWKWNKPLSARLLPFRNLKAGDRTRLVSEGLANTTIQPVP